MVKPKKIIRTSPLHVFICQDCYDVYIFDDYDINNYFRCTVCGKEMEMVSDILSTKNILMREKEGDKKWIEKW